MEKSDLFMLGAGIAAAAIIGYTLKKGAGAVANAAGKAVDAVTPWNQENIFNQGATALYQKITGSSGTIGTDFYDYLHTPQSPKEIISPTIFTGSTWALNGGGGDQRPYTVDKWGNKIREPIEGQIWE